MASRDGDGGAPRDDSAPGHASPGESLPPELNPRGRRAGREEQRQAAASDEPARPHHDLKRGALIGGAVLLSVLSVGIVAGSGWAWWTYNDFKAGIKRVNAIGGVGKPAHDLDGKDQNLLVVGNDDRDRRKRPGTGARSVRRVTAAATTPTR